MPLSHLSIALPHKRGNSCLILWPHLLPLLPAPVLLLQAQSLWGTALPRRGLQQPDAAGRTCPPVLLWVGEETGTEDCQLLSYYQGPQSQALPQREVRAGTAKNQGRRANRGVWVMPQEILQWLSAAWAPGRLLEGGAGAFRAEPKV